LTNKSLNKSIKQCFKVKLPIREQYKNYVILMLKIWIQYYSAKSAMRFINV